MTNQLQKEVRIGNYLLGKVEDELDNRKVYWEAYQIKDSDDFAGIRDDWDKSIPLNEEWLIKFGFNYNSFIDGYEISYSDFSILFLKGIYDSCYIKNVSADCGNVHQLQNLFFVLSGEELTIKEETNGRP